MNENVSIRHGAVGRATATVTSLLLLLALVCSSTAGLTNGDIRNPGVIPPQAKPGGKTYGEWAAAWWQWALGIPEATNPVFDPTGTYFGEGQSGPVWFYAGTFGDSQERWCTMPAGKMLFMPVFNVVFGEAVFDCGATNPGVPCDVPTLQATAAENILAAQTLQVTIDGVEVDNVFNYRAMSAGPFEIILPEGAVFGLPAGTFYPNVADGYWLMLTPLKPGEHTIHTYVYAPDTPYFGTIEFDVITHLTVE